MFNYLYNFEEGEHRATWRGIFSKYSLLLATVCNDDVQLLNNNDKPWFIIRGAVPTHVSSMDGDIIYNGDNLWGLVRNESGHLKLCYGVHLHLTIGDKLFFDKFIEEQFKLIL